MRFRRKDRTGSHADELHFVETPDRWQLALSRYVAKGNSKKRHPVLLQHGLTANRFTFDLTPNVSLARYLANAGFDVWISELRGRGLSEGPSNAARSYAWGFSDYAQLDIPALISGVLKYSKTSELHMVGHSMGGILLYTQAVNQPDRLRSGIAIGSALDYEGTSSAFKKFLPLQRVAGLLPRIPVGSFMSAYAIRAGSGNAMDRFTLNTRHTDLAVYKKLLRVGYNSVPPKVLAQMAQAFSPGGLKDEHGTPYLESLSESPVPLLVMCGSVDPQCSLLAADRVANRTQKGQMVVLPSYGHFDPIIGRNAKVDVWPRILSFLEDND